MNDTKAMYFVHGLKNTGRVSSTIKGQHSFCKANEISLYNAWQKAYMENQYSNKVKAFWTLIFYQIKSDWAPTLN